MKSFTRSLLASAFIVTMTLTGCSAPDDSTNVADAKASAEPVAYSFDFNANRDSSTTTKSAVTSHADTESETGYVSSSRVLFDSGSYSAEMINDNLNAARGNLDSLQTEWEEEQARIAEQERIAEEERKAEEEAERQRQIEAEEAAEAERQRQAEQQAQTPPPASSGGSSGGGGNSSSGGSSSNSGSSSAPAPEPEPEPEPAPAPPSNRASAESVASQVCGASVTWNNLGPGMLGLYSWGSSGFQITTREGLSASRLNFVAAHECGHIMQYNAFGGDQGAAKSSLNAIYNTSGTMGLEQNADCIAFALGYSDTPGGYGTSCGGAKSSAASAIISGQRP